MLERMPLLIAFLTFWSTLAGGLFALHHKDRLHLILGFSAGVILGVVAFDLLPEIAHLSQETGISFTVPMVALVCGFLGFHIVEKGLLLHNAHEGEYGNHHHPTVGLASALALAGHSLTDGIAIGLAFQVSHSVGWTVGIAVLGHDFADGLNTVSLMLANGNDRRESPAAAGAGRAHAAGRRGPDPVVHRAGQRAADLPRASSPASCSTSAPATSCPRPTRPTRPS